jgi:hypothetical protein
MDYRCLTQALGQELIVGLMDYDAALGKDGECRKMDAPGDHHRHGVERDALRKKVADFVVVGVEPMPDVLALDAEWTSIFGPKDKIKDLSIAGRARAYVVGRLLFPIHSGVVVVHEVQKATVEICTRRVAQGAVDGDLQCLSYAITDLPEWPVDGEHGFESFIDSLAGGV